EVEGAAEGALAEVPAAAEPQHGRATRSAVARRHREHRALQVRQVSECPPVVGGTEGRPVIGEFEMNRLPLIVAGGVVVLSRAQLPTDYKLDLIIGQLEKVNSRFDNLEARVSRLEQSGGYGGSQQAGYYPQSYQPQYQPQYQPAYRPPAQQYLASYPSYPQA